MCSDRERQTGRLADRQRGDRVREKVGEKELDRAGPREGETGGGERGSVTQGGRKEEERDEKNTYRKKAGERERKTEKTGQKVGKE